MSKRPASVLAQDNGCATKKVKPQECDETKQSSKRCVQCDNHCVRCDTAHQADYYCRRGHFNCKHCVVHALYAKFHSNNKHFQCLAKDCDTQIQVQHCEGCPCPFTPIYFCTDGHSNCRKCVVFSSVSTLLEHTDSNTHSECPSSRCVSERCEAAIAVPPKFELDKMDVCESCGLKGCCIRGPHAECSSDEPCQAAYCRFCRGPFPTRCPCHLSLHLV